MKYKTVLWLRKHSVEVAPALRALSSVLWMRIFQRAFITGPINLAPTSFDATLTTSRSQSPC